MPPKENPERACEECIHFFACSRQCGEPMAQRSATGCECYETVKSSIAAAWLIERLTAENAALLEIAKNGKDCETCKNRAVCVQPGTDVAHWCDRCVAKCRCYGCGGDHWEWRGLPEAPEEGEKA